uniref:(northern house mosquito) hypothetical protein n=1 Tax=Culex pipiens TaxID=7175 RepID=A0A8D8FDZ1_CULPI
MKKQFHKDRTYTLTPQFGSLYGMYKVTPTNTLTQPPSRATMAPFPSITFCKAPYRIRLFHPPVFLSATHSLTHHSLSRSYLNIHFPKSRLWRASKMNLKPFALYSFPS